MGQGRSKQESFWDACSYGREWLVKDLIKEGIDINWKSHIHDCCPIHVASQGKPEIVKLLIEANCIVDSRDMNENTALHHAALSGHIDNVSLLLNAGAAVNASNYHFWTPLINAAYWNHPYVLKLLLDRGADPFWQNKNGRTALHELCRSKSDKASDLVLCLQHLVARMQEFEASYNTEETEEIPTPHSNGVPHCQQNGRVKASLYKPLILTDWRSTGEPILELRSSPKDCLDSEADFTPLIFASYHGHCVLVEGLLNLGASVDATDQNGWTSLHWAAQQNRVDVICILLKHRANRRAKDSHGHMAWQVTTHHDLIEALQPEAYYPEIQSNGAVSTDEEGSSSDDEPSTPRPTKCRLACHKEEELLASSCADT